MGILDEWADDRILREVLTNSKNIAIVGLSDNPSRPSFGVARYLMDTGYSIFPVNPRLASWQGVKAYPSLLDIPSPIDLVDVFRRSEDVMPVAMEAIEISPRVFWMQSGIVNRDAARLLSEKGITVVMDRCIKVEIARLKISISG